MDAGAGLGLDPLLDFNCSIDPSELVGDPSVEGAHGLGPDDLMGLVLDLDLDPEDPTGLGVDPDLDTT